MLLLRKVTNNEYSDYIESLKNYNDLRNVLDTARDEGKIEGKIEGEQIGIEKGKIEGKVERDNEIIVAGYKEGFSPEQLSKLTKLDLILVREILQRNGLL